jgi:hypothetical protein
VGIVSGGGLMSGGRKTQRTEYVTPTEKRSLLAELGQRSGQAIEALGLALDTPGAIARGFLAGDPLSGFSFDRNTRVTGEELLDSYGLKPENPYLSTPAGFAAELITDPLAYATFALQSGGRAAQAAAKAGLKQYAPQVASLKRGADATTTGKYTLTALEKAGIAPKPSVLATRPLVGPRLAGMTTTLDEVTRAAPNYSEALAKVQQALGDTPYSAVKDERIGGLFGFQNPLTGQGWGFNPNMTAGKIDDLTSLNTAERIADALDRVGQGIGWSYPARVASAAFDKAVGGRVGVADQIYNMRRSATGERALLSGRSEATQHAMRLSALQIPEAIQQATGVKNFFSPEGADALLRLVEGKPIGNDADLLRGVPGLGDWITGWKTIADSKLNAASNMGLKARALNDPFGVNFSPRSAPELDFADTALNSPVHASLYAAHINNQIARNKNLFVPGGTYQLQQISLDPRVRAFMKGTSQETEEQIGAHIAQLVGNPLVGAEQGAGIARVFRRLGPDVPDNVPVFGTHPVIEQMQYIINEDLRVANADSAIEALAEGAIDMRAAQVPGGRHVPLNKAFAEISSRLGFDIRSDAARTQLKSRVLSMLFPEGTSLKAVKFKNLAVPEEMVNRIIRTHDFYAKPEVQSQVASLFDKFTTLFKSSVLAWPSRFARDAYSNVFSIWLESGDAIETAKGFWAGSKLLDNKVDGLADYFRRIPRYAGLQGFTDEQVLTQVRLDVGSTGILQGLATTDLLSASRRGDIGQFIPGSTPVSVQRGLATLMPEAGIPFSQRLKDFATIKGVNTTYETKNPVYLAANQIGDAVDSTARLAGFFTLMRQGFAPEEASRRMMRALVDYSSLTPFERGTMRKIFPWWAYTSRIGKFAVENLLERPGGRYGQTIRAINDLQATTDESYIPTALRQRFAIRVPEMFSTPGSQTFLTDIDLPGIDTLNMVRLGYQPDMAGSLLQTGQNTLAEVLQQANPLVRSAAELATGQDFFSKRPLDQAVTPLDTLYRAASGDQYARLNPLLRAGLSNAISAVPLGSRGVSAAANLVDARVPDVSQRVLKTLVNNLTGVKGMTVDPEYEALDAINKIKEQLAPYNREFVQSYIPKDLLPRIPLESQRMDALSRDLQRDVRQLYQKRYAK